MDMLQDIYYQPNHFWKGQKAIRKLKELSKEKPSRNGCLNKLFGKCIYLLQSVDRRHYEMKIPNEMHKFDLLYMPSDTLYRNK